MAPHEAKALAEWRRSQAALLGELEGYARRGLRVPVHPPGRPEDTKPL